MIDHLHGIHTPDPPGADALLPDRPRVKDVARWLGVHVNSVYGWIRKGEIPCKRVGKRTYIFEKAALLEWAKPEGVV
jgi:excisionase family DNA binding protein